MYRCEKLQSYSVDKEWKILCVKETSPDVLTDCGECEKMNDDENRTQAEKAQAFSNDHTFVPVSPTASSTFTVVNVRRQYFSW